MTRILVVGAGATGGFFGARLAQAGRDVTFLVRTARAAQLQAGGLQIVSPLGDATVRPTLATAGDLSGSFDVVLVGVKSFALAAAMDDMAPAVGPQTVVMPLLNGMAHMDRLAARFGAALIGGVCMIASEVDAHGRIVQFAPMQALIYGELSGPPTPRVQALDAAMQGAGFDATLSSDIAQAMWEKWVMLASLGAITCLMRAPVGRIEAVPGGPDYASALLREAAAVAAASGYPMSGAYMARQTAMLTAKGSPLTSSMYRDMAKGAPVEAEHILGDLFARAKASGVAAPLLHAALTSLRIYQAGL